MNNKGYRPNWMMRLACILLCLTMISMNLLSGIYARYSVTASAGDSARVAKFDIQSGVKQGNTELTKMFNVNLAPGESAEYVLQVKNAGEVAVKYTLEAQFLTNNLPLSMNVTDTALSGDVWTASGTLAPGAQSGDYQMTIAWGNDNSSAALAGEVEAVRVVVRAEQID